MTVTTRVQEARELLDALGMDAERSNERSALVLLSLLGLQRGDAWSAAANPMLGIHAIMKWIRDKYEKSYAPNTRETIRRFTLQQFELRRFDDQVKEALFVADRAIAIAHPLQAGHDPEADAAAMATTLVNPIRGFSHRFPPRTNRTAMDRAPARPGRDA